ncbi:MAG TPA: hypothetical protein VGH15_12895 [Caulobacteraceae bacterium]
MAIVTAGENPSFDYYLAPRLALNAAPPVDRFDLSASRRARESADWQGVFLLFCRYLSDGWLRTAQAHAGELAGTGLFIDDDFEALAADKRNRWRYRWKLRRHGLHLWPKLTPRLQGLWVSTAPLAELWARRPGAPVPRLTPPLADEEDLASTPSRPQRPLIGLHATSSHGADQRWLGPVVREVLAADPRVDFEVVADPGRDRLWRGEPRIRVIPYRSWPAYRADTAAHGRDLLLAPLQPGPANAARAYVKRIDAARCGAALMVSDSAIFQVSPGEVTLGMVAPLEASAWVKGVLGLIGDEARRQSLIDLNREKLTVARRAASALFEPEAAGMDGTWRAI